MRVEEIVKTVEEVLRDIGHPDWKYIILGIIKTESSFNPLACRFEPGYRWLKEPVRYAKQLGITVDTEMVFQKTSWGLMQVMGAVFRELGYKEELNKISCDVERQIRYGVRHFHRLYLHYKDLYKAILGYNRGFGVKDDDVKLALLDSDSYLSKVLKHSEQFAEV